MTFHRPRSSVPVLNSSEKMSARPLSSARCWAAVSGSGAVVVVLPEYDASLPGVLKNALDWLGRLPQRPLAGKPVAMETASLDATGGIRAQGHLRDVLISLDALVLNKPEVNVPFAHLRIDDVTQTVRDQETRTVVANQLRALLRLTRDRWEQAA